MNSSNALERLKTHLRQGSQPEDELLEHLANSQECFRELAKELAPPQTRSDPVRTRGAIPESGGGRAETMSERGKKFAEKAAEQLHEDLGASEE